MKVSPKKSLIPTRKSRSPIGKSEINLNTELTFNISTIHKFGEVEIIFSEPFYKTDPKEFNSLFSQKVNECLKICDFSLNILDKESKIIKTTLLNDLCDCFKTSNIFHFITPQNFEKYIKMVFQNIYRPLPNFNQKYPDQVNIQFLDNSWPHLNLIYKSFYLFLEILTNYSIDNSNFLLILIKNCCSYDKRERLIIKDILKLLFEKSINKIQLEIINKILILFQHKICSLELLEFYYFYIKKFENKISLNIFTNSILILHLSLNYITFCSTLLDLITLIIKNNNNFFLITLKFLIKFWPYSLIKKQILFLSIIESFLLTFYNLIDLESIKLIFKIISDLINQPNRELSEISFNIFLGSSLEPFLFEYIKELNEFFNENLLNSAKKHWNEEIRENSQIALEYISEIDENLFNIYFNKLKNIKNQRKTNKLIWKNNWKKIFQFAKMNDNNINLFF